MRCKAISLFLLLSGCVLSGLSASDPVPPASVRVDDLRERAHRRFERALFLKPEASEVDLPLELAPLFVQDVSSLLAKDVLRSPIATPMVDTCKGLKFDFDSPTVYVGRGRMTIQDRDYDTRVFVWFTRATPRPFEASYTSVELVLDDNELPLLAYVRESRDKVQARCGGLLFVSESLEQAAKERFGEPIPGREFSIEREPETGCAPIVVRTFEPGPVPMGPYVYLDRDGNVTTLLCRCSPSQMDDVANTIGYRLEPLANWYATRDEAAAMIQLDVTQGPIPRGFWEKRFLEPALRWPFDPPSDNPSNEDRRDIP